ncbi:hypothetical protein AB0H97_29995 [Streptomyces sp. NPDC050788]|uniref:hypothetical protein n=1 Tax=Streptomyces sp. NPDC050788 TaxID=3155041 RepID=UPI003413E2D5
MTRKTVKEMDALLAELTLLGSYTVAEEIWDCPERERLDGTIYSEVRDCGTVRVRVAVEVEATGRTLEQACAQVLADDDNESPEVRAAARVLVAGGPQLEAARAILRATLGRPVEEL